MLSLPLHFKVSFPVFSMFFLAPIFAATPVFAAEPMKEDNKHVRVWNQFAQDTLKLHKQLTAGKNLQVKTRIGSYANTKNFYIERRYFSKGKLVSLVQWEKDNPETLHTIEVYLHDQKGRVTRDFVAAYLPFYHNAPTQTLASFHHYNGNLHAFRSFDASGYKVLERCNGKNSKGQVVNLLLDENDLLNDPDDLLSTKEYRACFEGLKQQQLGKYITPQ